MIRAQLCYPIPLQSEANYEAFLPAILQFRSTWNQFPPGCEFDLVCMCLGNEPTQSIEKIFEGLNPRFMVYTGDGMDIGAAQWLASISEDCWQVSMSTRTLFHREGWLKYMLDAIKLYGDGLYGTCASHEGGTLHIRTNFYALWTADFRSYPQVIDSRERAQKFESGSDPDQPNILDFSELELQWPSYLVYWDGVRKKEDWFTPANRFREGDQSNCLVWDHHHIRWFRADETERWRLSKMAYPVDNQTQKA